ncbi:DMT family transporter [Lelliottia nimipressuralis]|uniref:DMT family transporter n=1 Tax=Lelliottia nimipressuralis TaxID=69220 RepID=UPI003555DB74
MKGFSRSGSLVTAALFLAVSVTWGTTWMAMKIALTSFTPVLATGLRFLLASPVLIGLARAGGHPLLFPAGKRLFQFGLALFYFSLPFSLMIYAEETVSSGMASLLFAVMPVAVLSVSWLLTRQGVSRLQLFGTVIVMMALGTIIIRESGTAEIQSWTGVVAILLAVGCHAVMYVLCKKHCSGISVLTSNALPCLGAAFILLILGLIRTPVHLVQVDPRAMAAVIYLGVVAGILGIMAYFQLQKRVSPFRASMVYFIFPLIALSLDDMLNGQAISPLSALMVLPFLAGIFLVLRPTRETGALSNEA